MFVPVVDYNQKPLMPTKPSRARKWIKSGKATGFWKKGVFCVRLNEEPSAREMQPVVVGVDPGSKKEGFTVKSQAHTFLNIQADAVTWVSKQVEERRICRNSRRQRNTPYRKVRFNRKGRGLAPSTKARWQWKLRVIKWLHKLYPITKFVVEDIKARTTGNRQWNFHFSPLQMGKTWFYTCLEQIAPVVKVLGFTTKQLRDSFGLKKTANKLANNFNAHCVDSWVLANSETGGHSVPDNVELLLISPLRFHRRQLHLINPLKGGIRRLFGGTRSLGLKRGSLIKHAKYGLTYIGGVTRNRVALHDIITGQRLSQHIQPKDCKFLTYNCWRFSTCS
jgi:hypothetical protein